MHICTSRAFARPTLSLERHKTHTAVSRALTGVMPEQTASQSDQTRPRTASGEARPHTRSPSTQSLAISGALCAR